ncbi:MAG: hypothetical protein Q8N37_03770 [bacterium]|nr:hypothetical protein [bacterium]
MNSKRTMNEGENNMTAGFDNKERDVFEENEARPEEDMLSLEDLYEQRNKEAGKIFDKAKVEIEESEKGVKIASKGLSGIAKISYEDRRGLVLGQQEIEDKINKLEYDALEIPENKEGKAPSVVEFRKEIPESIRKLKGETKKIIDELRSKREDFVKKFIEESTDDIKDHFKDSFRETVNGKNAEKIIVYKTKKEIEQAAKRFIETGDEADFGFKAALEVSSYKIDEVDKKFVTGYTIDIGGYEKKIRKNDNPSGARLVPGSKIEEMGDITRHDRKGVKKEKVV